MIRIGREKVFYRFDKDIPPALTVVPGDILRFETRDSHDGTIRSEEDRYYTEQCRPNPATGPIALTGIEPGDTLLLDILDIRPGKQGFTMRLSLPKLWFCANAGHVTPSSGFPLGLRGYRC